MDNIHFIFKNRVLHSCCPWDFTSGCFGPFGIETFVIPPWECNFPCYLQENPEETLENKALRIQLSCRRVPVSFK